MKTISNGGVCPICKVALLKEHPEFEYYMKCGVCGYAEPIAEDTVKYKKNKRNIKRNPNAKKL